MRPGPSPKPTKLKRLAGNPGKRPLNDGEPQFWVPERMLRPPDHLDNEGRAVWRQLGKMLLDAGLFTAVDRYALEMFCSAASRYRRAEVMVRREGEVLEGAEGGLYQNPWLHTANKAWDQMRKMFSEFGLTPAERSRIKTAAQEDGESIADILIREAQIADDD